jgi:hypothetical protein
MSLSVARNWLWNFSIGYATPHLVNPNTTGLNGVKVANLGVKVFTPQIPLVRPFLLLLCNKYEPYLDLVTLAVCFDCFSSSSTNIFIIAIIHSPVLSPDHPQPRHYHHPLRLRHVTGNLLLRENLACSCRTAMFPSSDPSLRITFFR